jgi:tRNA(Ile)-lysidine synthase
VLALIVDHGLRTDSAQEARSAMHTARSLGAQATVLSWDGEKPRTGIQAAARRARHGLLAEACRAAGIDGLLLAHNLEDQAETVWMRLRAGGDWRSCIGMKSVSPSPIWPEGRDIRLLRPLLSVRRSSLRTYLGDRGESWIEDPSNTDLRFTRIGARQQLSCLEGAGFDQARLSGLSHQLHALDEVEKKLIANTVWTILTLADWGGIHVDVAALRQLPPVLQLRLVRAAIWAVSGRTSAPRGPVCKAMLNAVSRGGSFTGGGAQLVWKQERVWLVRDLGGVLGRVDRPTSCAADLAGGVSSVWDGRYEIETALDEIRAEPLGMLYAGLEERELLECVPGRARPGLMVLRRHGTVLAIAGLLTNPKIVVHCLMRRRLEMILSANWHECGHGVCSSNQ